MCFDIFSFHIIFDKAKHNMSFIRHFQTKDFFFGSMLSLILQQKSKLIQNNLFILKSFISLTVGRKK